ncbi:MAG TPA: HDOD domain-containing protein [Burkholderiales bacterium]|nr:HDOD domain-containing protein [Burkholderiales bacterium]
MPNASAIAQLPELRAETELFVGRQSILDRDQNLIAFELLFRANLRSSASGDDVVASAAAINHAFNELGIEAVLGKYRAFISLPAQLIVNEVIELLPRQKVVLELLDSAQVTDDIVERCKRLKSLGFALAVDASFCFDQRFRPLLALVNFVRIDIVELDHTRLWSLTKQLKPFRVKLLAVNVDTREQARLCEDAGFDLFQGYYFARPQAIAGKRLTHSESGLMKLLSLVLEDADNGEMEKVLKQDPGLTLNLMRMVNSAAVGARSPISSLGGAIMVLGRQQLQRWLQLLLYANRSPGATFPSPLLQLVATRGKLMELLAGQAGSDDRELGERAFMAGILSLMDTLLGQPIDAIVAPLNLADDVKGAVLQREGLLGRLLALTEKLDQNDLDGADALLEEFPAFTPGALSAAQAQAMRWANSIGQHQ